MKKYYSIIIALLLSQAIIAQTGPIDTFFEKYAEKEGFTSIYISGKMLKMLGAMNTDPDKPAGIMSRLNSIRILSDDDSLSTGKVNFYSELSKALDFSVYEELMVVREGPEVTKFLVRQNGESISELLMITGGSGGNSLISIKGDLNLRELAELSQTIGIEELEHLENADSKKIKK